MDLPREITKAKVFMVIKTYPTLSHKYGELVCTAGICQGHLVRIYPIRFRSLKRFKQFKKYQWIQIDLVKRQRKKDFRLESYSPSSGNEICLLNHISSREKNYWQKRMEIIDTVPKYRNLQNLIELAKKEPFPSLAILKPTRILDFIIEPTTREWTDKQKMFFRQQNLFGETEVLTLKKLPYKYFYQFLTEDTKERKMMIEDWEIGALYWNCLTSCDGDEKIANEKVKEKYLKIAQNPSTFFFVGTTFVHHMIAPNPFVIIGVVSPNFDTTLRQGILFGSSITSGR